LLLEEAGAKIPTSNGMLKTPQQMLMEQTGLPQKFADGGQVGMSVQDMLAAIMAQGQTPQKFADGGSSLKHKAAQAGKLGGKALLGLGLTSSLASAAQDMGDSNPGGVALNALDVASFLSANPWLGALSGVLSPSELGKGTVEEYESEFRPENASILYGTRLPPNTKK